MTDAELRELVQANSKAIERLAANMEASLRRHDITEAKMEERSRSTTQVVNLAFALIASATVAVVVKIALGT